MNKPLSKLEVRRRALGERVGGGYIVFRRGKKWNRIRLMANAATLFHAPFEWATEDEALLEASRLAVKHPGEKFCVFKQISMHRDGSTDADAAARVAYQATVNNDPIVHCNRFSSWDELTEEQRNAYRSH